MGSIFEDQLKSALLEIENLKRINEQQTETIKKTKRGTKSAMCMDGLEAYINIG